MVIITLVSGKISPDVAMLGGLTVLMFIDALLPSVTIISPSEGIAGFAHPAVIMIAGLFIIAAGLQETGATEMIASKVLGRPKSVMGAQIRLMFPVAAMSAFMNNTAVVAMYMPIVTDWSRSLKISASKFFIPLSYAAILGGTCTLIATASNVTVTKLYQVYMEETPEIVSQFSLKVPAFWWVSLIGIPVTVIGIGFIAFGSRFLLPSRKTSIESTDEQREYHVEMIVMPGSPIIGKTIEAAGLRHLPGLYLVEIQRGDKIIPAVGPNEILRENDLLTFVGVVESVLDLRKIRGLEPAGDQVRKIKGGRRQRSVSEAVISGTSPLIGMTVRNSRFRTRYNAAIIAVHRNGHRVKGKIGDIKLQTGDTLLLETHAGFVEAYRNSNHFYLVSPIEGAREIRHERAWLSIVILVLMVSLLLFSGMETLVAVLFCAGMMVLTRCCTGTIARRAINIQVLVVIAGALGLGKAMQMTGAAEGIADLIISTCSGIGSHGFLFLIFALTSIFAQLITNNGAAVLVFPIAMQVHRSLDVNPEPFVLAVMLAAACNFMTPVSYQTNLMVYGPGGYKFIDFVRIGVPLTLLVGILTTLLGPIVFPF